MSDEAPAFTNRTMGEPATVTRIGEHGSLHTADGWGYGGHPSLLQLQPGDVIEVEYLGSSGWGGQIVGARRLNGDWLYRKSDTEIEREHADMLDRFARQRRESLDRNREQWTAREAALPGWLKERLGYFHERGGQDFELDGWGYELVVCELAALYFADSAWIEQAMPITDGWARMELDDPAAVTAIADREGTSGNQHMVAQALALAHARDPQQSLGGSVSALAPLTGNADYSPEG